MTKSDDTPSSVPPEITTQNQVAEETQFPIPEAKQIDPASESQSATHESVSDFIKMPLKQRVVLLSIMAIWALVFCTGVLCPSENYRYYVRTIMREGVFFDHFGFTIYSVVIVIISWTWTNILILACISAALGEAANHDKTGTKMVQAFARGIFIYFMILAGQMLFVGSIVSLPDTTEAKEQKVLPIDKIKTEHEAWHKDSNTETAGGSGSKDFEKHTHYTAVQAIKASNSTTGMSIRTENREQQLMENYRVFNGHVIKIEDKNLSDMNINQYFKLAGFTSLLCFLVGYNPDFFASIVRMMEKSNPTQVKDDSDKS